MKALVKVNDYSRVSNKVKLGIRRTRRAARIRTLQQNRRTDKITRLRKPSSNPNKKKILNEI